MKTSFRELLKQGRPILLDGAMGTRLYDRGIFINQSFDQVNLSHPDYVARIHREYVEAGADVVETNTFGANRFRLTHFGLEDQLERINAEGVRLAKEAAGDEVLVAGSLGPPGIKVEPYGPTSFDEVYAAYKEQAAVLAREGVDLFVLETFSRQAEVREAVRGIREVSDKPIIACLTINDYGQTLYGTEPVYLVPQLEALDIDVIGLNCSVGPRVIFDVMEQLVNYCSKPLAAIPNAGMPKSVDGRNIYLCTPEYMETFAKRFLKLGVSVIGGCCGTEPEHIAAMRKAIGHGRAFSAETRAKRAKPADIRNHPVEAVPLEKRSNWGRKIKEGEFVYSVEIVPPKGCDPTRTLKRIKKLKDAGVDAVNIPDGPRASSRMSPMVLALMAEQQVEMETILHYCCRDRNILGIQSDLLGGFAAGLKNILAVTGDPPKLGDYPDATAVFDVDSIGLTGIIERLNHGLDIGANPLSKPTAYAIGVALNPVAVNEEEEIRRFEWKARAGADFCITQPVFDAKTFLDFHEKVAHLGIPVVAGVWPLASYKNAEFMNNEVPGITIPEETMARMRDAGSGDKARETGLAIALENVEVILDKIAGVQISAPLGKVSLALAVADGVRAMVQKARA
ncbi:MAG: bifunctional homocysteine S-methyltransferase/methylenetetrahydrofolate reductase [Acidobacteriota bacterium]|nr:bifunctional homocysteine S-methyltransferase/methylenetetrahydrofolate reductase [Acidobacteriota bacterium]